MAQTHSALNLAVSLATALQGEVLAGSGSYTVTREPVDVTRRGDAFRSVLPGLSSLTLEAHFVISDNAVPADPIEPGQTVLALVRHPDQHYLPVFVRGMVARVELDVDTHLMDEADSSLRISIQVKSQGPWHSVDALLLPYLEQVFGWERILTFDPDDTVAPLAYADWLAEHGAEDRAARLRERYLPPEQE